jgi:hypothetical protein
VSEHDDRLIRAIEVLKEPVSIDPGLDDRVMDQVESTPAPLTWAGRLWRASDWMRRGRTVTVSPLGGLAFAAGLVALVLAGRALFAPVDMTPATTLAGAQAQSVTQFVIVAPAAGAVSLVGDFNDWSASATPMQRVQGNGVWSVTVPLDAGRYRYAFLVDGDIWLSDPAAPPALDDEFGRPGSVVTVGEL